MVYVACNIITSLLNAILFVWMAKAINGRQIRWNNIKTQAGVLALTLYMSIIAAYVTDSILGVVSIVFTLVVFLAVLKIILREKMLVLALVLVEYFALNMLASLVSISVFLVAGYNFDKMTPILQVCIQVTALAITAVIAKTQVQKIYRFNSRIFESLNNENHLGNSILRVAVSVVTVFFIGVLVIMDYTRTGNGEQTHVTLMFSIVLFAIVTMVSAFRSVDDRLKIVGLEQQRAYIDSYNAVVGDVKLFMHNYSNILQVLQICIDDEEITREDLLNTVREALIWGDAVDMKRKIRMTDIQHPLLSGVLCTKNSYAKELGVNLHVSAFGAGDIGINAIEAVEAISVLLDNAIEVAHFATDKEVAVVIVLNTTGLTLSVTNNKAYDEEGNVKKYGKSRKVGLGTLRKLNKKYQNVNYKATDGEQYIAEMFIGGRIDD